MTISSSSDTGTSAIRTDRVRSSGLSSLQIGGIAVLLIAAAVALLVRQLDNPPPSVSTTDSASNAMSLDMLVSQSVADTLKQSDAEEQAFLAAQKQQLAAKPEPEDVAAKLDRLAQDPKALAEHNRDVYNKVQLEAGKGSPGELGSLVDATLSDAKAGQDALAQALRPEAAKSAETMRTIVVQAGDTLSIIAQRVYGDPQKFGRIFDANPRVLTHPNHIFIGQVLRVP
jgi:nucleoid-associated protein YgaU